MRKKGIVNLSYVYKTIKNSKTIEGVAMSYNPNFTRNFLKNKKIKKKIKGCIPKKINSFEIFKLKFYEQEKNPTQKKTACVAHKKVKLKYEMQVIKN